MVSITRNRMMEDDEWIREHAQRLIGTYSLEEIIELADLTDEDIVFFLIEEGYIDPEEIPKEL